ncbi:MAG: hypothetical protein EOQ56_28325 [Mesorhizobium sp.]|nr:MAG: hypothetical protein EOQ56_28325 [Mesorhizobium sp.]
MIIALLVALGWLWLFGAVLTYMYGDVAGAFLKVELGDLFVILFWPVAIPFMLMAGAYLVKARRS